MNIPHLQWREEKKHEGGLFEVMSPHKPIAKPRA